MGKVGEPRNGESDRAVEDGLCSQTALGSSLSSSLPSLSKLFCLILLTSNMRVCWMLSACPSRSFSNLLCYQEKGLINFFFFFFLDRPRGLWDLSSLTGDRTWAVKVLSLDRWTSREFPGRKVLMDSINGLPSPRASVWIAPVEGSNRRREIKRRVKAVYLFTRLPPSFNAVGRLHPSPHSCPQLLLGTDDLLFHTHPPAWAWQVPPADASSGCFGILC